MKLIKIFFALLLSLSLGACAAEVKDLPRLYYSFSRDTYPYSREPIENRDQLKEHSWNVNNTTKLKSLPIYSYELLSLDELNKRAEELGDIFDIKFHDYTQYLKDDIKKLRLDGDSLTLTYYATGSFEINLNDLMVSFDDFDNDDLILQTANDLYSERFNSYITFENPLITLERSGPSFASVTYQNQADTVDEQQFASAYHTLTITFVKNRYTQIDYHSLPDVKLGDAKLLSMDQAIDQLKTFDDGDWLIMPEFREIYDAELYYCNAFDLKESIPVYRIYTLYADNEVYEMLAPAVKLDKEALTSAEVNEKEYLNMKELTLDSSIEPLSIPLPADLTKSMTNEMPALSYTVAMGFGAAGGSHYFYTDKQLEAIKNSQWNLKNFSDGDLFPIYHKDSLSKDEMMSMAEQICKIFKSEIEEIEVYEPVDFKSEDFVLTRENRNDKTQSSITVDTDLFYLRIYEHGTVDLSIKLAYSDTTNFPYSKNPESDFSGYIDKDADTEKNIAFFEKAMFDAYNQILKNVFELNNPIAEISEASASNIATNHQLDYYTSLVETIKEGSLSQQLFAASYHRLTFSFVEEGLTYISYTPILGTKVGDAALLSIDDAIAQWNQHIGLPFEPDEILTVTISYNTEDYLYDTIPMYNIYHRQEDEIINTSIPAVTIDADLFYAFPLLMYELHQEDSFH